MPDAFSDDVAPDLGDVHGKKTDKDYK